MGSSYQDADERGQRKMAIARAIEEGAVQPIPQNGYRLVVADPPWTYNLRELDRSHRGRTNYPTMTDDDILSLINGVASEDAYFLLWVTNNHMELGLECLANWGFKLRSIHTWVKTTKQLGANKLHIGLGHYGRSCTEHFLVGSRGKVKAWSTMGLTNIPNVIFAPRREHSRKPEEFFVTADRLRLALGGEAIELFARQQRPGWDCWGAEVETSLGKVQHNHKKAIAILDRSLLL